MSGSCPGCPDGACPTPRLGAGVAVRAFAEEEVWTWRPPTDLVCLVELPGPPADLEGRTALLRTVIAHVRQYRRDLRVGLVGYRDHSPGVDEGGPIADRRDLAPIDDTFVSTLGWTATGHHDDVGAPLEDALAEAATMAWRDCAQRRVLVMGVRAPHPPEQNTDRLVKGIGYAEDHLVNRCSHGRDWGEALDALHDRGVRVTVVRGSGCAASPYALRDEQVWAEISDGPVLTAGHGARTIAGLSVSERTTG